MVTDCDSGRWVTVTETVTRTVTETVTGDGMFAAGGAWMRTPTPTTLHPAPQSEDLEALRRENIPFLHLSPAD